MPDPGASLVRGESLEVPRATSLAEEIELTKHRVHEAFVEARASVEESVFHGRAEIRYHSTHLISNRYIWEARTPATVPDQ